MSSITGWTLDGGALERRSHFAAASSGRRAAILQAAIRLWGRSGYADLTLRRVAVESHVALALIDHHFGGKPKLFREATTPLRHAFEDATAQYWEQHPEPADWPGAAVDVLMQPINEMIRGGASGLALLRLWQRQINDPTPEVAVPLRQAFKPIEASVARLAAKRRAAVADAAANDDPLGRLCRLAFGTGVAMVLHELWIEPDEIDGLATHDLASDGLAALEPARFLIHSVFAPSFERLALRR